MTAPLHPLSQAALHFGCIFLHLGKGLCALARCWLGQLLLVLILLLVLLFATGCTTPPRSASRPPEDNTARLLARPDFNAASRSAPAWVSDALSTITRLEAQFAQSPSP